MRHLPRLAALLLALVLGVVNSLSQTSIIFAPTAEIQEKKSVYLNLESYGHFARYANGGFQSYGPSITYGLTDNVEIGVNGYVTDDESGTAVELQPNVKWRVYQSKDKKTSIAVGSIFYVPLNEIAGNRTSATVYTTVGRQIDSANGLKLTGGLYQQINGGPDFGTKTGVMVGVEQPITKRLDLLGDWTSGRNKLGYANIGLGYGIKKSQYLVVAYSFGNSGRGNNFLTLYYGFNF